MEQGLIDRYLEPPPRLVPAVEALPYLGGMTLSKYQGEVPDEMELYLAEPLNDAFSDSMAQEILKRALGIPKVRDRLGRGRMTPIGVSRRGEKAKSERRMYLVVAYDYTANVAVEISLDEQGELLGISDERYQPPPLQSEIDSAIELARQDERITNKVRGLVAMAIPFSGANQEYADRRVLEVLFACRTDRLPKYRAWVDLGTESVLHAGETCECCDEREEVLS